MLYIPYDISKPLVWESPRNGKYSSTELGAFFNGQSSINATLLKTSKLFLMEDCDIVNNNVTLNERASKLFNLILYGDVMITGVVELNEEAYDYFYDPDKEVEYM